MFISIGSLLMPSFLFSDLEIDQKKALTKSQLPISMEKVAI